MSELAAAYAAALAGPAGDDAPDGAAVLEGAEVLDRVRAFLARFVAFPTPGALDAVALWAAHTHALSAFDSTPRLAVLSPEPQSGKTRCLETLDLLVNGPLSVANTTVAVLARTIDAEPTTVLLDESDAIFGSKAQEHEDLRAILNAGHRRGASYARMVGEGSGMQVKRFATFAPVALAGIGDLPLTIMQRAVVVRMRRRGPGEHVTPFRFRDARAECEPLRDALSAWCADRLDVLTNARPVMPEGIEDRPADVWEPLLAVADAAGGDWPARARAACVDLVAAASSTDSGSLGVRLLDDLRRVFADLDVLHTEEVLSRLHNLEEAPWGDLRGKPLDPRGLARRLRAYGVTPAQVWSDGTNRRGYRREDLHDAWARYLPIPPGNSARDARTARPQVSSPPELADAEALADANARGDVSASNDHAPDLHVSGPSGPSAPTGEGAPGARSPGPLPAWHPAREPVGDCFDCGQPTFTVDESARPCHPSCALPGAVAARMPRGRSDRDVGEGSRSPTTGPCARCGAATRRYGPGGAPLCPGCRPARTAAADAGGQS